MADASTNRVVARLLLAAGALDLLIAAVAARLILWLAGEAEATVGAKLLVFAVIVLAQWFVVETILHGRSIGRLAMGIELRGPRGEPIGMGLGLRRFFYKSAFLGLSGLDPVQPDWYDRKLGIRHQTDLLVRHLHSWQLAAASGPDRGRRLRLGECEHFKRHGFLVVGRKLGNGAKGDRNPNGLELPRSAAVSGIHCHVGIRDGVLMVRDVGTRGGRSLHGTFVSGRKIQEETWTSLDGVDSFRVADVTIQIIR